MTHFNQGIKIDSRIYSSMPLYSTDTSFVNNIKVVNETKSILCFYGLYLSTNTYNKYDLLNNWYKD